MDHTVDHFEIPADDIERAKGFYSELFGWEFSTSPGFPDYWMFRTSESQSAGGGLSKRQAPGQGIVNFVTVESVAEYAAKAQELGGQVVVPKTPVPGFGYLAQILDSEGNAIGIWETDKSVT